MDINHISVSRKKCYDTCQQQYKYKYHLRLPSPGPEPFYFAYGKLVHKVAETYVQEKGARPIGEICQDLVRGKVEIDPGKVCPELPPDYQRKLQKHLRAIQQLTDQIGFDGITEHEFRYDLDPPNNRNVTGFLDRLIIKGDKAFIIDYKTTKKGKWRTNKETVKQDLQLRVYARVVQREFGIKAENIKCALYFLEGPELVAAQYSEESLLEVERDLKESFIRIQIADPDKVWGNVGWHCQTCDYKSLCPFFKPQNSSQPQWDGSMESLGHDTSWET